MGFLYPYVPGLPIGWGRALHLYHLGHVGALGVELFFVLSGFLIGGIILRSGDQIGHFTGLRRFYVRRWFRTLPNYYVFLLFNVLVFASWSLAPPFLIFAQNLTSNRVTFFPESWSLAVEEWFYLLFPLAIWSICRIRRSTSGAVLTAGAALYLLSTALRLVYAARPENDWAAVIRVVTVLRFDAIMTGVLAAWISVRFPAGFGASPRLTALAGLALVGFCYSTLYWYQAHNETFFARTFRFNLISLGFALLLPWAVALRRPKAPISLPIESVAIWSYSMYFINLPLWYFLSHVAFTQTQKSPRQAWSAFFAMELGSVTLAAAWYFLFERRMTGLRDRMTMGKPAGNAEPA
jgi:peptidoglycan/LPS O-acetylase OafA/YrhL